MAFEDDMIEAGYSDEQEYLDSLIDEYEENCNRQTECYDPSYYEELKRERRERRYEREKEEQCVDEWKKCNPDLAIIWCQYFNAESHYASISQMDCIYRESPNELKELKKWLNERKRFEAERQKKDRSDYIPKLFSLYQNELFEYYFPEDEKHIKMSIVSRQAQELRLIELYEPTLFQYVSSNYRIEPKFFEKVEVAIFLQVLNNREMDLEYWKDTNNEQYDFFAKQWIANNSWGIIEEWKKKHEAGYIEWKNKNMELWEKYAKNYEIREKNKIIKAKIEEFRKEANKESSRRTQHSWNRIIKGARKVNGVNRPSKPNSFLPDKECNSEVPFDTGTLDQEIRDYIEEYLCSIDLDNLSAESSRYADKVLTQLWVFVNRDDWEMDEIKNHYIKNTRAYNYSLDLFQHSLEDLLDWWKEKYKTKWNDFITIFKKDLETVLKFRLWALDGNKDVFFSLGEKYLIYWRKTIKLIYGYDIKEKLDFYFCNESTNNYDFFCEDVDHIRNYIGKHYPITNNKVEIWQKELQDEVIWDVFFNNKYKEHFFLDSMYMKSNINNNLS